MLSVWQASRENKNNQKHLKTCYSFAVDAVKDGQCDAKWGQILNLVPKEIIDQEILRALEYKFFNMTNPTPLDTIYQHWDDRAEACPIVIHAF